MKRINKLAVISLLSVVGAFQAPAAATTPTMWVQTLNFSLVAPDASVPAGKYTISSKNILELLAGDIITNTSTTLSNYSLALTGTNPATAAALVVTNNPGPAILSALSTNAGFPTNANITVPNVGFSVSTATDIFTNTIDVVFTAMGTNVYSFNNAVTLTGNTNTSATMTAYLVTNDLTFSFADTNYGSNVTVSITQPATSFIVTNEPAPKNDWVLVPGSLSEPFTNHVVGTATNIVITTIAQTNTFAVKSAKLAYVTPLATPTNSFWWVLDAKGNKVADVSAYFNLQDVAPTFDVTVVKGANTTVNSLQSLAITGHQGTQIVLEGLFAETLSPRVKSQSYPTIVKSLTADVAGTAQINGGIDPANQSFTATGVVGGRITTTGSAK